MIPDPRITVLGAEFRGRFSTKEMFPGEPEQRRYHVSLPVGAHPLHYRVLSAARATLAEGDATSSRFGEIAVPDIPDDAVAVEITHAGKTRLILVEHAD